MRLKCEHKMNGHRSKKLTFFPFCSDSVGDLLTDPLLNGVEWRHVKGPFHRDVQSWICLSVFETNPD